MVKKAIHVLKYDLVNLINKKFSGQFKIVLPDIDAPYYKPITLKKKIFVENRDKYVPIVEFTFSIDNNDSTKEICFNLPVQKLNPNVASFVPASLVPFGTPASAKEGSSPSSEMAAYATAASFYPSETASLTAKTKKSTRSHMNMMKKTIKSNFANILSINESPSCDLPDISDPQQVLKLKVYTLQVDLEGILKATDSWEKDLSYNKKLDDIIINIDDLKIIMQSEEFINSAPEKHLIKLSELLHILQIQNIHKLRINIYPEKIFGWREKLKAIIQSLYNLRKDNKLMKSKLDLADQKIQQLAYKVYEDEEYKQIKMASLESLKMADMANKAAREERLKNSNTIAKFKLIFNELIKGIKELKLEALDDFLEKLLKYNDII